MRLLLVVRDRRSRRILSHELTEDGHTVASAPSPRESLVRLEGEPFDVVVIDVPVARRDEMKLIRTVKERWPETQVIVVPGSSKVEEAVGSLGYARVEYARPSADPESVLPVLERIEKRGSGSAEPSSSSGVAPEGRVPVPSVPFHLDRPEAHELGQGRLELSPSEDRVQKVLRIDATGAPPNLLARLLVGSYITGQDQVLITAHHGLTAEQRSEIHRLVDRTLGMSVVGDSPEVVEIQNFIDPGKHELVRLLHRMVQMLRSELGACRAALATGERSHLDLVEAVEEEVDRFYLLMVRQLLLSSDSPQVARNIDVESHHFQIGYRLVAKVLEVTGDLIHGIGTEIAENLPGLRRLPSPLIHELIHRLERFDHLLTRSMDSFGRLSVVDANTTLNEISEILPKDAAFARKVCLRIPNRAVAVAAQRIAYDLDMALEMLVIVNEVTINRSVEPETVARTGTRVPMRSRLPTKPPHSSPAKPARGTVARETSPR